MTTDQKKQSRRRNNLDSSISKQPIELRFDLFPIAERLQYETKLLEEWFTRDYPESTLRVNADFNGVLFSLKIVVEVLMGEEVAQDRLFFKSAPINLMEKDLRNKGFMEAFFRYFNEGYRKQIQNAFNKHYAIQKEKEEYEKV